MYKNNFAPQPESDNIFTRPVPLMPEMKDTNLIKELKLPIDWRRCLRKEKVRANEVDLACGVRVLKEFPDKENLLQTAYHEFTRLCTAFNIPEGDYTITTEMISTSCKEAYTVIIQEKQCLIQAADTEGIRRGIYFVMDEILRSSGPYMQFGTTERHPVVKTRISRCFYSPTKRLPRDGDQLIGDIDYYPEGYLSRLAWEGTNAMWLSVRFSEICKSPFIKSYGQNAEVRLTKLRDIVKRCGCYGIKIFLFCIEPVPVANANSGEYRDMLGGNIGGKSAICVSTPKGRKHLEECVYFLFNEVCGLGGLINISVGERFSNCCSIKTTNCPKCSKREPYEVINDTLNSMKKGMKRANADAELISWPYTQYGVWGAEQTVDYARKATNEAVLQYNFSQNATIKQLGKDRRGVDYLLSYPYSSDLFKRCAKARIEAGGRIGAKLQVSNSHEIATVPFIPVPGNIYDQFTEIHKLGVSLCMYCWFFGGYPSLMTKAAGELSFSPYPAREEFFERLGAIYWGENAKKAIEAWKLFEKAYRNYPISAIVGYYGPMHNGPVWPLHLNYENLPLAPNWLTLIRETAKPLPPSGDRYGEYICSEYSAEEILELFTGMSENWQLGQNIIKNLNASGEVKKDNDVSEAINILFKSGVNITRFYIKRDELYNQDKKKQSERQKILDEMREIVEDELVLDEKLLIISKNDSRLGYHGEAEGHKFYPELIEWRMEQLEKLLSEDFPVFEEKINKNQLLRKKVLNKKSYLCLKQANEPDLSIGLTDKFWKNIKVKKMRNQHKFKRDQSALCYDEKSMVNLDNSRPTFWRSAYTNDKLYIAIECFEPNMQNISSEDNYSYDDDFVKIYIENRKCWPMSNLTIEPNGNHVAQFCDEMKSEVIKYNDRWEVIIELSMKNDLYGKQLGLNIVRSIPEKENMFSMQSWSLFKNSWFSRLCFGSNNPDDCGVLSFK